MIDLIDRQTLLRDIEKYHLSDGKFQHWVEVQPSVEAEPVRHGKWVYGEDEDGVDGYRCDKCGFFVTWDYKHTHIHFIDDYLFCPHCNARMNAGVRKE